MRGIPEFNFPAFDEAKAELIEQGWYVISPADLDREGEFNPSSLPLDHEFEAADLRHFANRDTDAVLSLHKERGDAIVLLPARNGSPGWEDSVGARAEVALALWMGLSIYVYNWEAKRLVPVDVSIRMEIL